jgi:hypothetical protein
LLLLFDVAPRVDGRPRARRLTILARIVCLPTPALVSLLLLLWLLLLL